VFFFSLFARDGPLFQTYRLLTHFEASGSLTYPALCFLWQRATSLQSIRITNSIVMEV
jgi:hypothetical protein